MYSGASLYLVTVASSMSMIALQEKSPLMFLALAVITAETVEAEDQPGATMSPGTNRYLGNT